MSANQALRSPAPKIYRFSNGMHIQYWVRGNPGARLHPDITVYIDFDNQKQLKNDVLRFSHQKGVDLVSVSNSRGYSATFSTASPFEHRREYMSDLLEFLGKQSGIPADEVIAAANTLGVQLPQTAVTVSSFASQNSQWLADHRDELTGLGLKDKHIDALEAAKSAEEIEGLQYDMREARGDYANDTPLGTLQGNSTIFTQYIKEAKSWERG